MWNKSEHEDTCDCWICEAEREIETDISEDAWGVFKEVCTVCGHEYVSAAPMIAHVNVELWECMHCGQMSTTHELIEIKDVD